MKAEYTCFRKAVVNFSGLKNGHLSGVTDFDNLVGKEFSKASFVEDYVIYARHKKAIAGSTFKDC